MDLKLSSQVAIVTGASRGIGRAIAQTLSVEGMRIVLVARSQHDLEAVAASLPTESLVQAVDLRKPRPRLPCCGNCPSLFPMGKEKTSSVRKAEESGTCFDAL